MDDGRDRRDDGGGGGEVRRSEPRRMDEVVYSAPWARAMLERGPKAGEAVRRPPPECALCDDEGHIEPEDGSGAYPCRCTLEANRRARTRRILSESGLGALGEGQRFADFRVGEVRGEGMLRAYACARQVAAGVAPIKRLRRTADRAEVLALCERLEAAGRTSGASVIRETVEGISEGLLLSPERDAAYSGLFVVGRPGSGKSHLLRATCLEANESGIRAVYTEAHRFFRRLTDTYNRNSPVTSGEVMEELVRAELVCLDDLGDEDDSPHRRQLLFELLDRLTTAGRTLVVSSNLGPHVLAEIYGRRTLERITDTCALADVTDEPSHRGENRANLGESG